MDWSERLEFDRRHVWHPFTQMKEHERMPPLPVVAAEGSELVLADGRRIFDGVASWWTSLHGHSHPRLAEAIARQARTLDHVMFAGFTHSPAIDLVARLRPHLPSPITRFFFSDDGSTAVEVALKMTFQAQHQRGRTERTKIGALRGAYHGDTLGAVGVGELENFMTAIFRPLLLRCERLSVPADPRRYLVGEVDPASVVADGIGAIDAYFAAHGAALAAFICEPLVQGANGMFMWPHELLVSLRNACDRHGVYLVFDEVMTGFGRTGTFLACEQAGVTPDVICLSKMLTGGTLPLALTCATDALFDVFLAEPEEQRAFLHGHSYTANPIACAAASESLALYDENNLTEHAQQLGVALRAAWRKVARSRAVRNARTLGTIAACDLLDVSLANDIHRTALMHGLLVRPIGSCLYLLPPLATPIERIENAVDALARSLPD